MKHKDFKKMIQLYLYNELDEQDKVEFEKHMENCNNCKQEFEETKNVYSLLTNNSTKDLNEDLLNEARVELRGALRYERNKIQENSNSTQLKGFFSNRFLQIGFSAASFLILGFLAGYLIFHNSKNQQSNSNLLTANQTKIENINFIDSDPSDGEIEFTFDTVHPNHFKGNINNPKVQNILAFAMVNAQNPGTRLNSINALNASKNIKIDEELKNTLITAAKYDQNPGVRREAMLSLKEIPIDNDIKDTFIYVVLNDTSAGLRIAAINCLMDAAKKGITLSQSDLDLLQEKTKSDNNNYVKYQTKNILKEF